MDKLTAQRIVREPFKAPFDKKRYRDFINETRTATAQGASRLLASDAEF